MGSSSGTLASDFEGLLRPHVDYLYRIAFRFTGVAEDAEDLVQDLLVKLYPRTAELAELDQLRPWLVRALYRQFVDHYRRRARARLVELDGAAQGADPFDALPGDDPGPEARVERELSGARLLAALDALSDEHRTLVTLHDVEGYTLQELERILETPVGTLKSRLHRARARLRVLIGVEPLGGRERVEN
ncbi:MAG: RNA polymerase sigma factor [Gammaproteobacteria bacterium]|nr:RNA polymerase sigma factor [Gammaproteobacteria bacterium]